MSLAVRRLGVVLCLALFAARPALAADDPKARAKALLKQGNEKFKAGDYHGALDDFRAAYEAFPSAKILLNEGQAYKALDEVAPAADAFSAFLEGASADTTVTDQSVEAARAALRELDPKVVLVRVDLSPRGAALTLDGKPVRPDFHLARSEDPGIDHKLAATAPGFQPAEAHLTLGDALKWAGTKQALKLELKPSDALPTPPPSPAAGTPGVTPGATQLAQNEKPAPTEQAVSTPAPGPSHTPALVAFGVGGALAVGAAAFGIAAVSQNGKLSCGSATNPCTGTDADTATSAHDKARIADLLWLGAAVAGGTGAVLWFVAPSSSGSGGEVGIAGRF